jgi:cation:H+ antiporter
MASEQAPRSRKRDLLTLCAAGALPLPWLAVHRFEGIGLAPVVVAVLAGLAILGAAFLLSWASELAERDIPQGLAILFLALVSVLPEYAVDLHFAWTAGKDPSYAPYAVANMTGANRLLIGLGWAVVVLIACRRMRTSELRLDPAQGLELRFLIWATFYSFLIPLSGTINLLDAAMLLLLFGFYAWSAMQGESKSVELVGPPMLVDREFSDPGRRIWAIALFVFAATAIFVSAEPFADSLVEIGRTRRVDEFLLVQWVAPLASESPEFLVAILFALRMRASVGIGALISSKVNQWTLLVGAIPVAYAFSIGGLAGIPLDSRQTGELVLTSSQSLLAAVLISDMRFQRSDALWLFLLFLGNLLFTSTEVRTIFTGIYLGLAITILSVSRERRRNFLHLATSLPANLRGRAVSPARTPSV